MVLGTAPGCPESPGLLSVRVDSKETAASTGRSIRHSFFFPVFTQNSCLSV